MDIYRGDSIIELSEEETLWFLDPSIEVPAEELYAHEDIYYRNFRDKVEQIAKEIYFGTRLTVMIYGHEGDDEIAICAENGLIVENESQ
jgi:hypothetical protein